MRDKILYPFQYIGAKAAFEAGRFLIGDDMGMFKTAQSILVNNKVRSKTRKLKTLVICPTSVKDHWEREIRFWGHPKGQEIVSVHSVTKEEDIARARDAEWTIIHYPLISILDKNNLRQLVRNDYRHIIIDEAHNAKNPDSLRTKAVRKLADDTDYLTMLSGTPIPNTIADIYMLMHLLEPSKYPLSKEVDGNKLNVEARQRFTTLYWKRPQEFKELIHKHMISRKPNDVGLEYHVPRLDMENIFVDMDREWLETYDNILDEQLSLGAKIKGLERALLDPALINPEVSMSPKYEALDEIIARETRKGGKVLVFTNLKEGVVDKLVDRYDKQGAIAITGDIPADNHHEREMLRQKFQQDPKTKVLIATTVMNEGVDLTAATAFVNLMLPWTPAEYQQRNKRSARIGEIEKESVKGYNILGKYPGKWRKSLDEASLDMLEAKQRIIKYLMSDIRLSREELQELQDPKRVPRINYAITSDSQAIFLHYLGWRAIGTEGASKRIQREDQAKRIADIYPNFTMTTNAAHLYMPVVEELKPEEPWLDLAGGPGMLGYFSQKKVHVLDIDPHMLAKGKELGTGWHKQGSFAAIPHPNSMFGLVNCSLAFQMSEPKKELKFFKR